MEWSLWKTFWQLLTITYTYPMTQQWSFHYFSKRNKNICLHKRPCMNVYSGLKLETTQVFFNWDKICFIHTMEYYLVMKKNELVINATTWINLKCIMLNKGSLVSLKRLHNVKIHLQDNLEKTKLQRQEIHLQTISRRFTDHLQLVQDPIYM